MKLGKRLIQPIVKTKNPRKSRIRFWCATGALLFTTCSLMMTKIEHTKYETKFNVAKSVITAKCNAYKSEEIKKCRQNDYCKGNAIAKIKAMKYGMIKQEERRVSNKEAFRGWLSAMGSVMGAFTFFMFSVDPLVKFTSRAMIRLVKGKIHTDPKQFEKANPNETT